jgi:hypothetical protein
LRNPRTCRGAESQASMASCMWDDKTVNSGRVFASVAE